MVVNLKLDFFFKVLGEIFCDVCVVGGGFIGFFLVIYLVEKGYDVVLFEV